MQPRPIVVLALTVLLAGCAHPPVKILDASSELPPGDHIQEVWVQDKVGDAIGRGNVSSHDGGSVDLQGVALREAESFLEIDLVVTGDIEILHHEYGCFLTAEGGPTEQVRLIEGQPFHAASSEHRGRLLILHANYTEIAHAAWAESFDFTCSAAYRPGGDRHIDDSTPLSTVHWFERHASGADPRPTKVGPYSSPTLASVDAAGDVGNLDHNGWQRANRADLDLRGVWLWHDAAGVGLRVSTTTASSLHATLHIRFQERRDPGSGAESSRTIAFDYRRVEANDESTHEQVPARRVNFTTVQVTLPWSVIERRVDENSILLDLRITEVDHDQNLNDFALPPRYLIR